MFPIMDVLFDGTSDAATMVCEQILSNNNFHRLQVDLRTASDDLDDASPNNLTNLSNLAVNYLERGEGARLLNAIAERLSVRLNSTGNESYQAAVGHQ